MKFKIGDKICAKYDVGSVLRTIYTVEAVRIELGTESMDIRLHQTNRPEHVPYVGRLYPYQDGTYYRLYEKPRGKSHPLTDFFKIK